MNLTLTQSFHRTQTLSGELKAAESALTDCEADAKAKERIASIAAEAVEKAKGHLETLRQEREELAEHMAALVRKTGEAVCVHPSILRVEDEQGRQFCGECHEPIPPTNVFTSPLYDSMLENAESRVSGAFERATQ